MADKEIIQADTIMAPVANLRATKGTYVQRAGLFLAAGVGAVIALVILGVFILVIRTHPALASLSSNEKCIPLTIEAYKELSTVSVQNAKELFQVIVIQALLPVLTAILGYIFARGDRGENGTKD